MHCIFPLRHFINGAVMESSSPMTSSASSPSKHRSIWSNRVHRELEKCRATNALPNGATLHRAQISESCGVCECEFHCFVPFVEGSDALSLVPRIDLVVHMSFSSDKLADGLVQYPFLAPEVEIYHGAFYLPIEMRERKVTKPGIKETITMLKLPLLDKWSPSTSLRMLMHEFFQEVQRLDPTPCISLSNKSTLKIKSRQQHSTSKKPMKMRRRDVRGTVYPCQEVDIATSTLKHVHLLLQAGNIALIVSSKHGKVEKDNDYVYVQDLISLKDVVRITPQRGKSLTLFFKDRSLLCRTFLSPYTDDIIRDLRAMINDSRQYSRDEAAAGSAAQLLPFLSAEQTEKAKEMSTKLMSKLGKVATSVSRFLRGDEDENLEQHVDPLAKAFADINAQKEICYRMPSKARVTEITRRYQNIAEEYAYLNNQEGHVERAISELQRFIEHPRVQRILMESVAYEQSTKGIRVGPA